MDQNMCPKVWKNWEDAIWEVMTSSEEWTDRESINMVQKVFGIREAKIGTKVSELL